MRGLRSGCSHKDKCSKAKGNRTVRLNEGLIRFHQEVLGNLNCIHGALLRMNRSIQAEALSAASSGTAPIREPAGGA